MSRFLARESVLQATAPGDANFRHKGQQSCSASILLIEATAKATKSHKRELEMNPTGNSAATSVEALQAAIDVLVKRERRWRKTGSKRALLVYLSSIYRLYATWKEASVAIPTTTLIARLARLRERTGRHPLRTVIEATSKADRRSKSRWTQALRFAWRERSKWRNLEKCLRANGGIAGCASKWADQQSWKRTPPGLVRVGGEDRVPLIPLFVGVELLDRYGNWC